MHHILYGLLELQPLQITEAPCGIDKTPWHWGSGGSGVLQNMWSTKICYKFFRAEFCSSDRRHYSGSLLQDVGVTSLTVVGGPPNWLFELLRAPLHVGRFLIPVLALTEVSYYFCPVFWKIQDGT